MLVGEPVATMQSAAFSILAPAGCVYDPPARAGLAGFTCEMLLRGAGQRDSREFILALDNLGLEHDEAVTNGHAGFGGAAVAENLFPALRIFADVLRRPHLPAEQLDAARLVMLQELRAVEDEPAQRAMIELRRRHYPDPWGRPAQGEAAALEAVSLADVQQFFANHFHPNGTILGVAGRFDWPPLVELVGELLGDWRPGPAPTLNETAPAERRAHLPCETNQTQIGVAWSSVPYRHPDYFPAWGAVNALSGGMSARLFTEVRERRGLCYSVSATHHTLRDRAGVFCYAGASAERAQETLDVLLAELVRLGQGIEPQELDRSKARAKSALVMQGESSVARAGGIARDWYHLGRARTLDDLARLVDELTCERVNAFLAANPPRDFTIVTLGPRPLEVPDGVC